MEASRYGCGTTGCEAHDAECANDWGTESGFEAQSPHPAFTWSVATEYGIVWCQSYGEAKTTAQAAAKRSKRAIVVKKWKNERGVAA